MQLITRKISRKESKMGKISREVALNEISKLKIARLSSNDRLSCMLDFWNIDDKDIEFSQLSMELQREILTSDEPLLDSDNKKYDELIMLSLSSKYKGVTNEFISKEMILLGLDKHDVYGDIEKLESCPCCCYRTLDSRREFDVCRLCYWEDSGSDDEDSYSGPNHMTLREGKKEFYEKKILCHWINE